MSDLREFLMLAKVYDPKKHKIKGWYASEKLDGNRCFWDGGISRGVRKIQVPWANNLKDERYITAPMATGLWSRGGNVISAPDWFLDELPKTSLDGELFMGHKSRQELSKVIKTIVPDQIAWKQVKYHVFDSPELTEVFRYGESRNTNFKKYFDLAECMKFVNCQLGYQHMPKYRDISRVIPILKELANNHPVLVNVEQVKIVDLDHLDEFFRSVLDVGGEGLIIRNPDSYWEPRRVDHMLKLKSEEDAEAIITGYIWGRKTDKGSKLLGKMGALITQFAGNRLELSGFTDDEREMTYAPHTDSTRMAMSNEGELFPGEKVTRNWINTQFPIGSSVTFKYRELSDDGIPIEARYYRLRERE